MSTIKLPIYGEHLVFAGTTGSGKSYLAQRMLERFDSYFAIDTQDSLQLGATKITSPQNLRLKLRLFKKIRYVPAPEWQQRSVWDQVFKVLLESSKKNRPRPKLIYIDEIYHIGYGPSFPSWLARAVTTARQRQLSFWISTQRPSNIPMPVLSECSRIFAFYLGYEEDLKKLAKFSRKGGLYQALMATDFDYSFIEIDRAKGTFQKRSKLKGD